MNDRVACDDIVWQNWLKLITANNHKKFCFRIIIKPNHRYNNNLYSGHTVLFVGIVCLFVFYHLINSNLNM